MKAHEIVAPAKPVDGFAHLQSAHCESGVTQALLRDVGIDLSEPMIFGIGSGLFFGHLSFLRIMGHPLTTFRSMPGSIFTKTCKRLGVSVERHTYRRQAVAMTELDERLEVGQRVGLQVNIFWLPYIPKAMRVHFNGHNLIVVERRGDNYVVSDPVMEDLFECPAKALQRARFSGGPRFLAGGLMYHPVTGNPKADVPGAVRAGLLETCNRMQRIPRFVPWLSVQGIRHLGHRIPKWSIWYGERHAQEWLAGVVRMQEEIGTGGAGFRYLFAAFLHEASQTTPWPAIAPFAEQMTAIGDQWRAFALQASRLARGRKSIGWQGVGDQVLALASAESNFFAALDAARTEPAQLELHP